MASSDTTVEVKIAASLDSSLQASTAAAKAEINGLAKSVAESNAAMVSADQAVSASSAKFFYLGNSLASLPEGLNQLSGGLRTLSQDLEGMSHGAISTAAREFRALFDELSSGRTRMTPGTLAIIAQRVYGLEASTLAGVAAAGLFAGALGYATYQAIEAEREVAKLAAGFELTGRSAGVSQGFIEQWVTSTVKIFDSAGESTKKIVGLEAANASLNATIINAANQIMPLFNKQYGEDAPKAMEHLLSALGNLTVNGFQKLDKEMLNLSPTQYATIENMIRTGHETDAATKIIELLGERGGIAIKSLSQSLQSLQAEAVKLRAGFLNDKDATDGLTRASQEYLRVLREIQGVKGAIANAPQVEADKTFKEELDLAEQVNNKLTERGTLEKNLASLEAGLASAKKIHDQDLINSFTQAIQKQQSEIAAIDQREAERRLSQQRAENQRRIAEERRVGQEAISTARETISQIETVESLGNVEKLKQEEDVWRTLLAGDKLTAEQRKQVQTELNRAIAQENNAALNDRMRQIDEEATAEVRKANDQAKLAEQAIQQKYQLRQIDANEEIKSLNALEERRYQLVKSELDAELAAAAGMPAELARINKLIEHNEKTHADVMAGITARTTKDMVADYQRAYAPIINGFNSMVRNMLSGNMTLVQSFRLGAAQMTQDFIMSELKKLEQYIMTQLAMTSAQEAGDAARTISHDLAVSQGMSKDVAAGSAQIMNDAYKAAAGTYQSVAQIPYVGWILAPLAAAGAFAAVAAFDVLSAEGGAWEVGGGLAVLHEKESVIPAAVASPMREFFEDGNGNRQGAAQVAPNVTLAISAVDGQSVQRLLRKRTIERQIARQVGKAFVSYPSTRGAY